MPKLLYFLLPFLQILSISGDFPSFKTLVLKQITQTVNFISGLHLGLHERVNQMQKGIKKESHNFVTL